MIDDKEIDALIEQALKEEQALPEGLSNRLSQSIDSWQQAEQHQRTKRRTLVVRLSSLAVAASLLLLLFVKWNPSTPTEQELTASASIWEDTYTDPNEAAAAAQEALRLLSKNLNKGMNMASANTAKVGQVKEIVKEQLTTN